MKALISSTAACKVPSVILNAQSIESIEIYRELCHVYKPNLTLEQKIQRLEAALTVLQRYHDDGDEFLDTIVTGNETWISLFIPKTNQQSMH